MHLVLPPAQVRTEFVVGNMLRQHPTALPALTVIVATSKRRLMTIGQDGNSRLLALFGLSNIKFHVF